MQTDQGDPTELWLVRHGPTEWSVSGQHTSVTDLPLLPEGEGDAVALGGQLAEVPFRQVLSSPRQRARRTAELAGYADPQICEDLVEWGYGEYEGLTNAQIRERVPGWTVWTHPCPGGESAADVAARCDRVIALARGVTGRTAAFAHGHLLRVLAARWLGLGPEDGRLLRLDTATISVLGFERETAVVLRWNA